MMILQPDQTIKTQTKAFFVQHENIKSIEKNVMHCPVAMLFKEMPFALHMNIREAKHRGNDYLLKCWNNLFNEVIEELAC
jgi:ureidoglycolate hydrolase